MARDVLCIEREAFERLFEQKFGDRNWPQWVDGVVEWMEENPEAISKAAKRALDGGRLRPAFWRQMRMTLRYA